MKIKINNKRVKIKTSENMTVSEYYDYWLLYEKEALKAKRKNIDFIPYVKIVLIYLAATTKYKFDELLNIEFSDKDIHRVLIYVGNIPILKEIETKKEFYYPYEGKTLFQNKINWQAVGVRMMLEEQKNLNPI
jgi:hypothetical protein